MAMLRHSSFYSMFRLTSYDRRFLRHKLFKCSKFFYLARCSWYMRNVMHGLVNSLSNKIPRKSFVSLYGYSDSTS